jgi:hypothetical protein
MAQQRRLAEVAHADNCAARAHGDTRVDIFDISRTSDQRRGQGDFSLWHGKIIL